MTTKRVNLLAGTILGGALLLGTAGLALAQSPTPTPTPSPTSGVSGGMMGGRGMTYGGMMGGRGMMGGQMDAGDVAAMRAAMGTNGTCDVETMQSMHQQYHRTR